MLATFVPLSQGAMTWASGDHRVLVTPWPHCPASAILEVRLY